MSSTRKNNTWHFRAQGHIGVQAQGQPIIHLTEFTTAKVHDRQMLEEFTRLCALSNMFLYRRALLKAT